MTIQQPIPAFEMHATPGSPRDFELWHWAVSPLFDLDAPSRGERAEFAMRSRGYNYSDMPISAFQSTASRFARGNRVIARAGLENIIVQVYEVGDYRFTIEGTERVARAGDVVAFDLTRAVAIETEGAFRQMSVIVPRHLLAPRAANLDHVHGMILRSGTPLNGLLLSHMRELMAAGGQVDVVAGAALVQATAALVAACLGSSAGREQATATLSAALLRRIRRGIEESLGDPDLGPDLLTRRFNLSRASLYRLFAPLGGVRSYIQMRRLIRVHQAISDPALFHQPIIALASLWGFSDASGLTRAYKALYGMTPSDARASARAKLRDDGSARERPLGSFEAVNRWLNGIESPAPR